MRWPGLAASIRVASGPEVYHQRLMQLWQQLHSGVHGRSMRACAKALLHSVSERNVTLTLPALAAGPHGWSFKGNPPFRASASPRQGGRHCSQHICSVHAAQVGAMCQVCGLQCTSELSRQWACCKPAASLCCRWDAVMQVEGSQTSKCKHGRVGIDRWQPGMTFGEFTERTIQAYYKPAVHSADKQSHTTAAAS